MQPTDVSTASLVAVGVVALFCLLGAVTVQIVWARRRRWLWISFGLGVFTFTVTQLLTRIPLVTAVLPALPEWRALLSNAWVAAIVLSFSAALSEETGRLIVMSTLLRRNRRTHADGVAFGLGHGGWEAFVLIGLSMVSVLVLGVMAKTGQWETLTATMPGEAAEALRVQLSELTVPAVVAGGLERVSAIALHIGLSVLVLLGVVRGRPGRAWLVALLVHGVVNLIATVALTIWGWPLFAIEGMLLVVGALSIAWVLRARSAFASAPSDGGHGGAGEGHEIPRAQL